LKKILQKIEHQLTDINFKEIIKGAGISFWIRIAGLILGYLFTLISARCFGAEAIGNFALAFIIVSFISSVSMLGMDTAVTILVAKNYFVNGVESINGLLRKVFTFALVSGVISNLILFITADFISTGIFHNSGLRQYIEIMSFAIIPLSLRRITFDFYRGLKKIKEYSLFSSFLVYLVGMVILSALSLMFNSNFIIPISYLSAAVIAFIISFISLIKYHSNVLIGRSVIKFKEIFNFSIPILFSDSLKYVTNSGGIFFVGYFLAGAEAGIYNIALKLATVTTLIVESTASITMPKFGEDYSKKELSSIQKSLTNSGKIIFWSAVPILFIVLAASKLIFAFLGSEFEKGFLPLIILSAAQFIFLLSGTSDYILQMIDKQKRYLQITFLSTFLFVLFNLIFVPAYGIEGAGLALLAGNTMQTCMLFFYLYRFRKLNALYIPGFLKRIT